jgi:hypothetical protein
MTSADEKVTLNKLRDEFFYAYISYVLDVYHDFLKYGKG